MRVFATAAICMSLMGFSIVDGRAQISDDVVKIGVLDDMSGLYADIQGPGDVVAVKLAVEDFGGSVNGKPIEVVSGDLQNKADVGSAIARRWYDVEKVDAILGLGNSAVAIAVQGISQEKKRVAITTSAGSTALTGKSCAPLGIHWVYDTYALAKGTAKAMMKQGNANTWFFITTDYAFGHALEADTSAVVKANGGQVLGAVRAPLNSSDFSSFVLQAQASKAQVVGLANAGADTINAIKTAAEFGLVSDGTKLAGLLVLLTDIHTLGLKAAQGLMFTEAFYWDQNDENSGILEALCRTTRRKAPDNVPSWNLQRSHPLLEGGKGGGYRRSHCGCCRNEEDSGQRFHDEERHHSRRRPHDARYVSPSGKEAERSPMAPGI